MRTMYEFHTFHIYVNTKVTTSIEDKSALQQPTSRLGTTKTLALLEDHMSQLALGLGADCSERYEYW